MGEGDEVGRGASAAERAAHERLAELRQQELTSARAAAERWTGTSIAVFAALGFASIVQGAKQIRGLEQYYEEGVAIGVVVAAVLAILAIGASARAAQELALDRLANMSAPELLAYESTESGKVQRRLRSSRWLLAVAATLFSGALGILFLAPTDDDAQAEMLAVTRTGEVICGELEAQGADGIVRIKPESGPVREVDPDEALSITAVEGCPEAADEVE